MSTIELKNSLVRRILDVENTDLLSFLDEIVPKTEKLHEINGIQNKILDKSLEDINNGNVSSHEEVMERMDTWLEE